MKKHLTLLLAVLMLAALLLSACAKTPVPPEKPPADTAETTPEPEKAPADTAEAPEAEAEQAEEPEEESEEDPEEVPEEAPQPVTFSVYYGDENAAMLLSEEVTVSELTPEAVVSELIRVGVLSEGTLVNRLELIAPYLYLDLSYEFLAKLQTMGSSGEMITVNSVVNTFLDAYGAELLLLSVNGSVIETGHTVYDLPLTKYENPEPVQEILLTVYRGNDNADAIIAEDVMVPEITPEVIMEQLILAGVLPEGCAVNSVDAAAAGMRVDFNEAFKTHVCSMGTTGEWIVLSSVTNTFLTAYGSEVLMFTVEGQILETGHNVYDFPLTFTP